MTSAMDVPQTGIRKNTKNQTDIEINLKNNRTRNHINNKGQEDDLQVRRDARWSPDQDGVRMLHVSDHFF